MSAPDITLYTHGTPNGHKASITFELLNIPYKVRDISFEKNEQKEEWFLKINPNGRIPTIVDHRNGDFAVFESGAIIIYLAETYDKEHKVFPQDPKLRSEAIQWLMFQMGGVGPMMGQANHFFRYAPEKIPYGIKRYQEESKRLISVVESKLQNKKYLVGDRITAAEISLYPWIFLAPWAGIDLSVYPNVQAWSSRLEEHEAFSKGLDVPEKNQMKEILKDPELIEKTVKEASAWIMKAQQK
ncbi:Glutathione S-transferase 2 [Entomophthora muscae]|uniref:Glutathione S-transferase 2 n=1 Tax=Entomophthora muscae TaxID=34485 RepID=A0ACC2UPC0_9FUNG|nr:Glutathione S-transferase 2 [Entomophthora muscae]